ncbi:MAG: TetR/AcrR family transcriptional regulator [Thioalkalispiraceae bacterium]|jgi:AcrR family transcriptional regulator
MTTSKTHHCCKWRRRKEARPAEIIDAALDLFVANGFNATKLDEVARQAGVSKGTVYLYFNSKEDLFRAAVKQIIIPEVEKAEHRAEGFIGSQRELLEVLLFNWWEVVGKTRLAGIPKLMVSEAGNFPELAKFYLENVVSRARNLLRRGIEKGIETGEFKSSDPVVTTRLLMAPLVFAAIWDNSLAVYDSEDYSRDEYVKQHIKTIFDGISNEQ